MQQLINNPEGSYTLWLQVAIPCLVFVVFGSLLFLYIKRRLRNKFRYLYKIVAIPSNDQCVLKAEGSSIEVGDYGWEAEPIQKNDLIYLHGLNDTWQVVWYAGFRPDQIELVGSKPKSQYYVYPDWMNGSKTITKCPFPVKKFNPVKEYLKTHFGFPVEIGKNWVQGKRVDL